MTDPHQAAAESLRAEPRGREQRTFTGFAWGRPSLHASERRSAGMYIQRAHGKWRAIVPCDGFFATDIDSSGRLHSEDVMARSSAVVRRRVLDNIAIT